VVFLFVFGLCETAHGAITHFERAIMSQLLSVRGIERTTPAFRAALVKGALARGLDPNHLATVISLESQFDPHAENRYSHALGLIQWVSDTSFADTARRAGMPWVKRADLRTMSAEEQLPLVFAWFDSSAARLRSHARLVDYYLAVWGPAHIGKALTTVVAQAPSLAYEQNKGAFDGASKGYFTIDDIARQVGSIRTAALGRPMIDATEPVFGGGELGPVLAAVAVALGTYVLLPKTVAGRRVLAFG
jgi:hypothetical protein